MRGPGEHPVAHSRSRRSQPIPLAFAVGLICLGLLPFIPVLPGVGSLLVLAQGVFACQETGRRRWPAVGAIVAGALGTFLMAVQVTTIFFSAVGISP